MGNGKETFLSPNPTSQQNEGISEIIKVMTTTKVQSQQQMASAMTAGQKQVGDLLALTKHNKKYQNTI